MMWNMIFMEIAGPRLLAFEMLWSSFSSAICSFLSVPFFPLAEMISFNFFMTASWFTSVSLANILGASCNNRFYQKLSTKYPTNCNVTYCTKMMPINTYINDLDHGGPLGDLLPFTPFILFPLLLHSFLFLFLLFFLLLSWLSEKRNIRIAFYMFDTN